MIQARLPDAILRDLPAGAPTAPLLTAFRAGHTEALPEGFAAWMSRNGWDAATPLKIVPAIAPSPPPDPAVVAAHDIRGDRVRRRWGLALLRLGAVLPIAASYAIRGIAGNDSPEGWWSVLGFVLGAIFFWLALHALPWVVATVVFGEALERRSFGEAVAFRLDVTGVVLMAWIVGSVLASHAGFALLARSRGLSPWLALLGPISLFFRDRNRP